MNRLHWLETHSSEVLENEEFLYRFLPEELEVMREDFVKKSVIVEDLEEEKKTEMKAWKDRIGIPKAEKLALLRKITKKSEWRKGQVYVVHDYDENRVYLLTPQGDVIESRPLLSGEQKSLLSASL